MNSRIMENRENRRVLGNFPTVDDENNLVINRGCLTVPNNQIVFTENIVTIVMFDSVCYFLNCLHCARKEFV